MPAYRVVRRIKLDGVDRNVGTIVTMDERRADWPLKQRLIVPAGSPEVPALMKPRPATRSCCGRK